MTIRLGYPLRCERGAAAAFGRVLGPVFAERAALDPAEKLLRAMLLHVFYSIRSERQLTEC
jgi:hypothetical protein